MRRERERADSGRWKRHGAERKPFDTRTRVAIALLAIAVIVWAAVLVRQVLRSAADAHIDAGADLARRGDGLGAVREWDAATKADPKNALAWQLLGQSYYEAKRWRQAADALQQLERLAPHMPRISSLLASCSLNLGDLNGAITFARAELSHNPNDVPALETLVAAETRTNTDPAEMVQSLKKLTDLEPGNLGRLVILAEALIAQNSVDQVVPVTDRILKLDPHRAEMYTLRGIARFYSDGTPEGMRLAEADFREALGLNAQQYAGYLYLGRIARRRGQPAQAAALLEKAVSQNPKKADAYFDLAAAYEMTGQPAKAAAARSHFQAIAREGERYVHVKKMADLAARDFNRQISAAELALKREDEPAARFYLQRAAADRPNDPAVLAAQTRLMALQQKGPSLPLSQPSPPATQ